MHLEISSTSPFAKQIDDVVIGQEKVIVADTRDGMVVVATPHSVKRRDGKFVLLCVFTREMFGSESIK
jgi:hypothetical protein